MKPVFADAFFYVACLNRADQHHQKAIAFASRWSGRMVTTRLVLIEVADTRMRFFRVCPSFLLRNFRESCINDLY